MWCRLAAGLLMLVGTSIVETSAAETNPARNLAPSAGGAFLITTAETTRPIGHMAFCRAQPDECLPNDDVVPEVALTDDLLAQLTNVNDTINKAVRPSTDADLYNVGELWTFPDTAGDCEDYVLAKRRALHEAGWPLSTLLIAVVRQASGAGHAVLTVRTDRGDLVLDNLDGAVHGWRDTPYTYLKRQSQDNAGHWVTITDDRTPALVASSGSTH